MPVVVAAVAVFVERKVPTRTELVALLLLTAGVIVSIFEGKASGNTLGISLSITGAHCTLGQGLISQRHWPVIWFRPGSPGQQPGCSWPVIWSRNTTPVTHHGALTGGLQSCRVARGP